MGDDELLRLASQWDTLTESAQAAVTTELEKRNLKRELGAKAQSAAERLPSAPPSKLERVMFWLFIIGLPSAFFLPRVWPESMKSGLYDLIHGLSECFLIWLIVWLVLRARRLQRMR